MSLGEVLKSLAAAEVRGTPLYDLPQGCALVVFAHGMGWCVAWQAVDGVDEYLVECGADHDGFSFEDVTMDHAPLADGAWIGELSLEDDGPGDWPGSREVMPAFRNERPATAEEWSAFLKGDYPWEPLRVVCSACTWDASKTEDAPRPGEACPACGERIVERWGK